MKIFIATAEAVYDHGCVGVFTTEKAAVDHCYTLWTESDGHHDFRIDEAELDAPRSPEQLQLAWGSRRVDPKNELAKIEVNRL